MTQSPLTPESGAPRIEPHYRLTEPLENRLADARALLALLGSAIWARYRRKYVNQLEFKY